MSENKEPESFHFDIFGVFPDGASMLLGHGDLPTSAGSERYHALVKMLRNMADEYENTAVEYEKQLRVFETPLGDKYFEISQNRFAPGDSYDQAVQAAQGDGLMAMNLRQLKTLFPELKEGSK